MDIHKIIIISSQTPGPSWIDMLPPWIHYSVCDKAAEEISPDTEIVIYDLSEFYPENDPRYRGILDVEDMGILYDAPPAVIIICKNEDTFEITSSGIVEQVNAEDLSPYALSMLLRYVISEREKSRLNKKITWLSLIVDYSPASVMVTDSNSVVKYINPRFTSITGYEKEDIIGRTPKVLQSGYHDKIFYREMWDTLLKGHEWKGELYNKRKDGEYFWELSYITPIKDSNGETTHYISVHEDITHIKGILEKLKTSEEKFRAVFESIQDGFALIDLQGTIIQVNTAFSEILEGESEDIFSGKSIYDFIGTEESASVALAITEAEKKGNSGVLEFDMMTVSNTEREVEIIISSMDHNRLNPMTFIFSVRDIHERKKQEKELIESKEKIQIILDAVPDIMFRIDDEGVYLDDELGKKVHEVFPKNVLMDAIPVIKEAFNTRAIKIYEYSIDVKGEEKYYEARFIVTGMNEVLTIVRNVTERKMAEDEMKKAKDEAQAANLSKSNFLANMSHEIRTPLNSIMGFIEILEKSELNDVQREYLKIVNSSARSLLGIINDILDFSKIESNRLEIETVSFRAITEFDSVINLFNAKTLEKQIDFISYIDPRIPNVIMGDPLRLKQVLTNLLSNAVKFTPNGGFIYVEIIVLDFLEDSVSVRFSVSDSGIGIPDYKQKQIFEKFSQADSSVSRKYGGTGLGLAISQNLVGLMNGELLLESTMGKGSTFYFDLKLKSVEGPEGKEPSVTGDKNVPVGVIASGKKEILHEQVVFRYLNALGFPSKLIEAGKEFEIPEDCRCLICIYNDGIKEILLDVLERNRDLPVIYILSEKKRIDLGELKRPSDSTVYHPVNPEKLRDAVFDTVNIQRNTNRGREDEGRGAEVTYQGRALIADDNSANQKLIQLILEGKGLETIIVSNGLSAYDKYVEDEFDIIFMDVNMPVADGIEATQLIRDYEDKTGKKHLPVIALTARAMKGDREELLSAGMDDYLAKPIETKELDNVLGRYLKKSEDKMKAIQRAAGKKKNTEESDYHLERVAEELGITPDMLGDILTEFFKNTEAYLPDLMEAIRNSDYEKIYMSAHRITGAAANFRLGKIAGVSSEIENAAREKKDIDYSSYYDRLMQIFNDIKTELFTDGDYK